MTLSIFDAQLLIDGEAVYELPRLAVDTRVHVWSVPIDYRADGLFVAVQRPGGPEEVPACASHACQRLGSLDYAADQSALLEALKSDLCEQINAERDQRISGGVDYAGHSFDTDPRSVRRIIGAAQLVALDASYSTDWITADNSVVHLDAAAISGLGQAVGAHESATVFAARQAKDAVLEAVDSSTAKAAFDMYNNNEL